MKRIIDGNIGKDGLDGKSNETNYGRTKDIDTGA